MNPEVEELLYKMEKYLETRNEFDTKEEKDEFLKITTKAENIAVKTNNMMEYERFHRMHEFAYWTKVKKSRLNKVIDCICDFI